MSSDDMRSERLKKLSLLRERGIDPYPAESNRTHENALFVKEFESLLNSQEQVTLAGRVMSFRNQGGISFIDLFDGSARVQSLVRKDDIGDDSFDFFVETVSVGDFIEVTGTAFTTKRGTNSLLAKEWRMVWTEGRGREV